MTIRSITINLGNGYKLRGKRYIDEAFDVVILELMHPNYGYYADYSLYWRSMHSPEWHLIPIRRGSEVTTKQLVKQHPQLAPLFAGESPDKRTVRHAFTKALQTIRLDLAPCDR